MCSQAVKLEYESKAELVLEKEGLVDYIYFIINFMKLKQPVFPKNLQLELSSKILSINSLVIYCIFKNVFQMKIKQRLDLFCNSNFF